MSTEKYGELESNMKPSDILGKLYKKQDEVSEQSVKASEFAIREAGSNRRNLATKEKQIQRKNPSRGIWEQIGGKIVNTSAEEQSSGNQNTILGWDSLNNSLQGNALVVESNNAQVRYNTIPSNFGETPTLQYTGQSTPKVDYSKQDSRAILDTILLEDILTYIENDVGIKSIANSIKKEEEKYEITNKDEELIINIEELADELADKDLKRDKTLIYNELLIKYKNIILRHERRKKE